MGKRLVPLLAQIWAFIWGTLGPTIAQSGYRPAGRHVISSSPELPVCLPSPPATHTLTHATPLPLRATVTHPPGFMYALPNLHDVVNYSELFLESGPLARGQAFS